MAGWAGDAVGEGDSRNHATTAAPPVRHSATMKDLEEGAGAGATFGVRRKRDRYGAKGMRRMPRGEAGAPPGAAPLLWAESATLYKQARIMTCYVWW